MSHSIHTRSSSAPRTASPEASRCFGGTARIAWHHPFTIHPLGCISAPNDEAPAAKPLRVLVLPAFGAPCAQTTGRRT